jgi:hypothetical protein
MSASLSNIGDLDGDCTLAAFALDHELDYFADANLLELVCQIRKPMHRLSVCRDNDVAELPIFRIHAAATIIRKVAGLKKCVPRVLSTGGVWPIKHLSSDEQQRVSL